MKKKLSGLKITLIVLAVIVIGIVAFVYTTFGDNTTPAELTVESGTVQLNGNPVSGTSLLKLNDEVKTINGEATVTLYDSVVVTLEPNSDVVISDLTESYPKVKEVSGSVWTKFADVVGVKNFDVETPTTVATVRGTEFGVSSNGNDSSVEVGEGNVDVTSDGKTNNVKELQELVKKNGIDAVLSDLTPEQKRIILSRMERTLMKMKALRANRILNNKRLMSLIQRFAKADDSTVRQTLDDIDAGRTDDEALFAKAPIKLPILTKLKKMDDKIKVQQQRIDALKQSLGA